MKKKIKKVKIKAKVIKNDSKCMKNSKKEKAKIQSPTNPINKNTTFKDLNTSPPPTNMTIDVIKQHMAALINVLQECKFDLTYIGKINPNRPPGLTENEYVIVQLDKLDSSIGFLEWLKQTIKPIGL